MKVLVTGGAGYIGSHTVVELIQAGHSVVIVDDLSNARTDVVCRVESIVGEKIKFRVMDCADKEQMRTIFQENEFDAVIHFAGRKAVGESVKKPLEYYRTNLDSTMTRSMVVKSLYSPLLPRSMAPKIPIPIKRRCLPSSPAVLMAGAR